MWKKYTGGPPGVPRGTFSKSGYSIKNMAYKAAPIPKVQSIFVHPGYDHDGTTTKGYDIALIKLADPVDYAINQIPICLPKNNDTLVGEIAWVKGFGRLSDGNYLL